MKIACKKSNFVLKSSLCVGIKGLAGRGGIGYGHTDRFGTQDNQPLGMLRQWIGEDCDLYAKR